MFKVILFQAAVALLKQFTKFKSEDLKLVTDFVVEAEDNDALKSGEERRRYVRDKIKKFFRGVAPFAADILLSLAVGYANKTGLIDLRNKNFIRSNNEEV